MNDITISADQNRIISDGIEHIFQPEQDSNEQCKYCSLFNKCVELQPTVENEFPFPCIAENRIDKDHGYFKTALLNMRIML